MKNGFREVLKNKNFFALFVSHLVSRMGDGVHEIALIWLVLELTGSALSIATVMIFSVLPNLIFGLFAGALVDTWDRKRTMIGSDLVRFLTVLIIPAAHILNFLNLWIVYSVAFLASIAETFFGPARQASIPNIVEKDELDVANSLAQLSERIAQIFSFAFGGVMVALIGAVNAFYIDSLSFLLSAVFILGIKLPYKNRKKELAFKKIFFEIGEGIKFIRENILIFMLLALITITNFVIAPIEIVMSILSEILEGGSAAFGAMAASFSVGGLVGALAFGSLKPSKGKSITFGILGLGVSIVSLSLLQNLAEIVGKIMVFSFPQFLYLGLACFSCFFIGVSVAFVVIPYTTLIQIHVPDKFRGRVFSVSRVSVLGAAPLSLALVGFLIEGFGVFRINYIIGFGMLLIGAICKFDSVIWKA